MYPCHVPVPKWYSNKDLAISSSWIGKRGKGWRIGESARLPPMRPGFDFGPVPHAGWVCRSFPPCSEGSHPGSPVFLPSQKQHLQIPIRPVKRTCAFQKAKILRISSKPAWKPAEAQIRHRFCSNLAQMLGLVSEWLWQNSRSKYFIPLR